MSSEIHRAWAPLVPVLDDRTLSRRPRTRRTATSRSILPLRTGHAQRAHVPKLQCLVQTATNEALAVRRESNAVDAVAMSPKALDENTCSNVPYPDDGV